MPRILIEHVDALTLDEADRVLLTLDEERIRHEAERRARRMVGRPLSQVREYVG